MLLSAQSADIKATTPYNKSREITSIYIYFCCKFQ